MIAAGIKRPFDFMGMAKHLLFLFLDKLKPLDKLSLVFCLSGLRAAVMEKDQDHDSNHIPMVKGESRRFIRMLLPDNGKRCDWVAEQEATALYVPGLYAGLIN